MTLPSQMTLINVLKYVRWLASDDIGKASKGLY